MSNQERPSKRVACRISNSGVVRDSQNRILLRRSGETTELGEQHPFPDIDPWRQGVEIKGNKEIATLKNGNQVTVARMVRGNREITQKGKSYFKNRRTQWMVNVPASKTVRGERGKGDRRWEELYTINDSTLQTFYNGDLLDENTESGRKQRREVWEAAKIGSGITTRTPRGTTSSKTSQSTTW